MFFSVFFANFALNLGQQMSNSLLAKYADSMGAPASQIGMLMSMFAVTALIFRFISGPAINSWNRKLIVMGAMCLMGISYLGFGFSGTVPGLMAFRLIQGVGNAFANVCCLVIVSDILPKDKFNTGIGYYSCAQVVSQAIGPTVGLALAGWFDYPATYIVNAGMMGVAILLATQIRLEPKPPRKLELHLSDMIAKEAFVPMVITFFISMGFTAINAFLLVYADRRGVGNGIGLFFTVYAVTMLAARPAVGKLTDRHGFVRIAVPSIILNILSFFIIGYSSSLPFFLLGAFVNALGYGSLQPTLQALCVQSVPAERRGSGSCTYFIGLDAATIIAPAIAGLISGKAGYTPVMWLAMTVPMTAGIGYVLFSRKRIDAIEKNFLNGGKK